MISPTTHRLRPIPRRRGIQMHATPPIQFTETLVQLEDLLASYLPTPVTTFLSEHRVASGPLALGFVFVASTWLATIIGLVLNDLSRDVQRAYSEARKDIDQREGVVAKITTPEPLEPVFNWKEKFVRPFR